MVMLMLFPITIAKLYMGLNLIIMKYNVMTI